MGNENNKVLLRRFIELWNTGNVDAADAFVSADLVDHTLMPGLPPALVGFKMMVGGFRAAFPDLNITIDEVVAQADKAAARVTFRGTQRGEFQGIPPSGKSFTMGAIGILRIQEGIVVEHWAALDRLGMLTQLGVVPSQSDLPYAASWPEQHAGAAGSFGDKSTNVDLVSRFFAEVCNERRLAVADELFAGDHAYHDPSIPGVNDGPAGIRQSPGPVVPYQQAFSDAMWHVDDIVADADVVVTRWHGTGAQDGELMGIPADGRKVNVPGIWWQRIVHGKIAESWQIWDTLGMLQQLGVIPSQEVATPD